MGSTNDLLTGIDEIDRQHQILFVCLARLEQAVSSEERWSAVHFVLDEVSDFARIHFAVEEALLRLHGYPLLEAHIAEHRDFVRELGVIGEHSVRADVGDEMVKFLQQWLVNHIGKSDHQYVPCLRSAGVVTSSHPPKSGSRNNQPENQPKKQEEDDAQHQVV